MSGHRRWDDIRVHVSHADPGEPAASHPRPPYCHKCGKRVRRWHEYGGFDPIGFSPKTADAVWHVKCLRKRRH